MTRDVVVFDQYFVPEEEEGGSGGLSSSCGIVFTSGSSARLGGRTLALIRRSPGCEVICVAATDSSLLVFNSWIQFSKPGPSQQAGGDGRVT
jgi:hypothetical protein